VDVTKLPIEAREGLERAWLAVLRERHPGVEWVIVKPGGEVQNSIAGNGRRRTEPPGLAATGFSAQG